MYDCPFDNLSIAEAHMDQSEDSWQEYLDSLPLCEICNEPIQQNKAVHYNDQWCCENCEDEFWENIREDFLEPTVI